VQSLTQSIDQLRLKIQADSLAYQQSESQLQQTQSRITQVQRQITIKRESIKILKKKVRSEALNLFIQGETTPWWFSLAQGDPSSIALKQEDASTASSIQQQAVVQYQQASAQLKSTVLQLSSLETQQHSAARAAQLDQSQVEIAVASAQSKLNSASSTVRTLVAQQEQQQAIAEQQLVASQRAAQLAHEQAAAQQAAAQQAAAQQAAAQQAAAQQAAAQQAAAQRTISSPAPTFTNPVTTSPTPPVSPGGYANPLRSISGLAVERIDQGVDYNGVGPIYAIGDGIVTSVYNGGWPGGVYIAYQLTSGPASGAYVYAAESIHPAVSVGESVTSSTELGTLYDGPDGIETGWANMGGDGTTMAAISGQFYGANSTAYGYNFSQLLQSLGAPGGDLTSTPTGVVSSNWPQWQ
jgi:murein DD-endopeptidase MepM/ murein hydrolase activator NlpD